MTLLTFVIILIQYSNPRRYCRRDITYPIRNIILLVDWYSTIEGGGAGGRYICEIFWLLFYCVVLLDGDLLVVLMILAYCVSRPLTGIDGYWLTPPTLLTFLC